MRLKYHGVTAVVFLCCVANSALAGLVVDVNPGNPTTSTPVSVSAWKWFSDPGQSLVETNYFITNNQILIDVIMQDLHAPGTFWTQIVTPDGGIVDLGVLTVGSYEVDATMYMIPWSGGLPVFYDSGVGSFEVVPEPTTLCLVTIGGLALLRRRR